MHVFASVQGAFIFISAEERKKRCHQTAAPVVQEVETTEEETNMVGQIVDDCKKAAEWVQGNPQRFAARVEMPDILSMDGTCTEEAVQQLANLFDATLDVTDDDKELILEPFKFLFHNIEDMWLFCEEIMDKRGTERQPPGGRRRRLASNEQETEMVNMVIANNAFHLREIQQRVVEDQQVFRGIDAISISTIDRILKRNHLRMKQAYRVPFERNSDVKDQQQEYVQVWVTILYEVFQYVTISVL
ncbi:hypothetical protein ABVT39_021351 [Epinephelus coioides]